MKHKRTANIGRKENAIYGKWKTVSLAGFLHWIASMIAILCKCLASRMIKMTGRIKEIAEENCGLLCCLGKSEIVGRRVAEEIRKEFKIRFKRIGTSQWENLTWGEWECFWEDFWKEWLGKG